MKPFENLGESRIDDGTVFSLHKHDGEFFLKYNGYDLMSTLYTYSEQLLAEVGCSEILDGKKTRPAQPRILIGGLGLGFTLKRTLELVGSPALVEVAELMPPLIEWNRTILVEHNGPLLDDPRTMITQGDLYDIIHNRSNNTYDALLLDIDNTPDDLITEGNNRLYTPEFIQQLRNILTPDGRLTYWLSGPSPKFKKLLESSGFQVEALPAKAHHKSKRPRHMIYICIQKAKK